MLPNELFHIIDSRVVSENESLTEFRCNVNHPIFKGHFPGSPVLPGVCMIRLVRDRLSVLKQNEYQLFQARSIKFIHVIDPEKESLLFIEVKASEGVDGICDVSAIIKSETTNFFQFKGKYKAQ